MRVEVYSHTIRQAKNGMSCGAHLWAYVATLLVSDQLPVFTDDSFAHRINFSSSQWERYVRTLMAHIRLGHLNAMTHQFWQRFQVMARRREWNRHVHGHLPDKDDANFVPHQVLSNPVIEPFLQMTHRKILTAGRDRVIRNCMLHVSLSTDWDLAGELHTRVADPYADPVT